MKLLHPKSYTGPRDKMNTLRLPSTKKYTFPQKHLKIRFGATGGPFSSGSVPFANLLSFPLAFAQTAHGTLQSWLASSGAGPHSVRSSVPLLCRVWVSISFLGGKQGREHIFLALLTSLIRSTLGLSKRARNHSPGGSVFSTARHPWSPGELANTRHWIRSGCLLRFVLLALLTLPVEDSGFFVLAVPF